ncbi:MAG: four helix bundle protein [Cyclobacteriaceae bacterium]|nr:four helix bundle protein [Cyclobacteriaceae bacterium]
MKSYRDLDIYIESKQLAIEVHKITLSLPKFELFEEGSQLRRSSKAVTSLIVEGYGRRKYKADFIKYLIYAIAECDESIVHLDFLFETGSTNDEPTYTQLKKRYEVLSRKINKFTQWVGDNWNKFDTTD